MKTMFPISLMLLPILLAGQAAAQNADTPAPAPAPAGLAGAQVSLAPLRIEMDGAETTATLRVVNPSAKAIGVQVRAFDWSQDNGEDVYSPSGDVRISPSIITVAPGATQVFRVIRREMPVQGERRYRVVVDQLPDPEAIEAATSQTRIRFTIPMFTDRASAAPAALSWAIEGGALRLSNAGQQTAKMVNLALTDGTGREIPVENASLHYVMGGSALRWALPNGCPSGPVRVTAQIDGVEAYAQVSPTCS